MSDPKKITEQTTLGELAVQRAILGITGLQIFADLGGGVRGALAHHATGAHIGRGRTEAIAIEDAFASVRRSMLPEPLKAIAEGYTWPPLIEAVCHGCGHARAEHPNNSGCQFWHEKGE
jgi:hypothetical protein